MQTIIVILIVSVVLFFVIRKIVRVSKGKEKMCNCDCDNCDCKNCKTK